MKRVNFLTGEEYEAPDVQYQVPPSTARSIGRMEYRLKQMGVEPAEEQPSFLQAGMDLLSVPSYATTAAYKYGRQGKNPLAGLLEGAYAGIRPTLQRMGFKTRKPEAEKEFWNDVIQEIPGFEPTESTWRNFGIRILGTLMDIGVDPLTYLTGGGKSAITTAARALRRQGVKGVTELLKTGEGRRRAAELLADSWAVRISKSGKSGLEEAAKGVPGKIDEIHGLLNLEYKRKGPLNLSYLFGETPLLTYEQAAKSGAADVMDAIFAPMGSRIISKPASALIADKLGPEVQFAQKSGAKNLLFAPDEERLIMSSRAIKPQAQAGAALGMAGIPGELAKNVLEDIGLESSAWKKIAEKAGESFPTLPPDLPGGWKAYKSIAGDMAIYPFPKVSENVQFWHRRSGLLLMDSLLAPISTVYRQAPWLNEVTRQYHNQDLIKKEEVFRDFTNRLVKLVPEKELENIPYYIELPKYEGLKGPTSVGYEGLSHYLEKKNAFDRFVAQDPNRWAKIEKLWNEWFAPEGKVAQLLDSPEAVHHFIDDYVTHIYLMHPEQKAARDILNSAFVFSTADQFLKERSLPTLFNALEHGFRPVTNAAVVGTQRIMSAIRAKRKAEFMKNLINDGIGQGIIRKAETAFNPMNPRNEGWISGAEPQIKYIFPQLQHYDLREDVAWHLAQNFQTFRSAPFLGLLMKVTNLWKPWVTTLSPKFHIRNFEGGIWNNWLAGVTNPMRYAEAAAVMQPNLRKVIGEVKIEHGGKVYNAVELQQLMKDNGILDRGQIGADIERTIREDVLRSGIKPQYMPEKAGRWAGQQVENNLRGALFLDRLYKGYSVADAALEVKKYHFFYDELTPLERSLRLWIPFYVWSRNNLPLQMESLVKQPGKYAALPSITNLIEGKEGRKKREEFQSDWMKENHNIYAGYNAKGEIRFIMPGLPYEDLDKYSRMRGLLGDLNPFVKLFVENAIGYDMFQGKPYVPKGLENQPEYHIAPIENAYASIIPKQFWPLIGMKQYRKEDGTLTTVANVRLVKLWTMFSRPVREAIRISDEDKDLLDRHLNEWSGMTVADVNPDRKKFFDALDRQTELRAMLKQEYKQRETFGKRRKY